MTDGEIAAIFTRVTNFMIDAEQPDLIGFARAIEQSSRRAALEEGYALGFKASGEGWNGEYPCIEYSADPAWLKSRDAVIDVALAGQPATGATHD